MAQQYADGWENPDQHRPPPARPMFDDKGRPVSQAPPPEPAPELDRMDIFGNPVDGMVKPGDAPVSLRPGGVISRGTVVMNEDFVPVRVGAGEDTLPADTRLAEIQALAMAALENPSPAGWAVALDRIVRVAERGQ